MNSQSMAVSLIAFVAGIVGGAICAVFVVFFVGDVGPDRDPHDSMRQPISPLSDSVSEADFERLTDRIKRLERAIDGMPATPGTGEFDEAAAVERRLREELAQLRRELGDLRDALVNGTIGGTIGNPSNPGNPGEPGTNLNPTPDAEFADRVLRVFAQRHITAAREQLRTILGQLLDRQRISPTIQSVALGSFETYVNQLLQTPEIAAERGRWPSADYFEIAQARLSQEDGETMRRMVLFNGGQFSADLSGRIDVQRGPLAYNGTINDSVPNGGVNHIHDLFINSSETVRVIIEFEHSTGDIDVNMLRDGNAVQSSSGSSDRETMEFLATPGTYQLQLYNFDSNSSRPVPYTVRVETVVPVMISSGLALNVHLEPGESEMLTGRLAPNTSYTLEMTCAIDNVDIDVTITSPNGEGLGGGYSGDGNETCTFTTDDNGNVAIRVYSLASTAADVVVRVDPN